jgi:hypothetical protein
MKPIDFGQIVQRIDCTQYAPDSEVSEALAKYKVYVWINPPPDIRDRREAFIKNALELLEKIKGSDNAEEIDGFTEQLKELGPENDKLLSILLSQHEDGEGEDTHWTPEEVRSYRKDDIEPEFIDFLTDEAWRLINEHRNHRQKKIRRRFKNLNGMATRRTRNSSRSSAREITNTS